MTGVSTSRRLGGAGGAAPGVTVYERDSGSPGPTLLVLGGVHGNEVGGVLAAGRLVDADLGLRAGRLIVVPLAHEAAYDADTRTGPADDGNLARVFPGAADGTPTEVVAALLTGLIAEADALVDLHTSSPQTDMPLFCGCLDDGSAASTRAVELMLAFGSQVVWTHGALGPGRSLGVARDRGIPAVYAEAPRGGTLDERALSAYDRGVRGILGALGMTDPLPPVAPQLWLQGDGDVDAFAHSSHEGLFIPEVELLDLVERGAPVGVVSDRQGRLLEQVRASESGYVATLRRHARVEVGTPLVGIVPARPAVLGIPSDALARPAASNNGDQR